MVFCLDNDFIPKKSFQKSCLFMPEESTAYDFHKWSTFDSYCTGILIRAHIDLEKKLSPVPYGNTGYRVFKWGVQNQKYFLLNNQHTQR